MNKDSLDSSSFSSNDNIMTEGNDNEEVTTRVVLALDVGSSSVRCTAYRLYEGDGKSPNKTIESLYGCSSSRNLSALHSSTSGHLHLKGLLDGIDDVVDDELKRIEAFSGFSQTKVVGLGFSSLSMNLVGINGEGDVVGTTATMSYACNSQEVAKEATDLQNQMGPERCQDMYQRTGAPIHSAYALPQLRAFYRNHLFVAKHVYKWQTIATLVLSRWTGRDWSPISFSEASWTGMLNFTTCEWDEEVLALLPEACRSALPPLMDCTDSTVLEGGIPEFPSCLTQEGDNSVASVRVNPYWKRWPQLRGATSEDDNDGSYCRLFLGIGDGACANIGSHACTPSKIAVTIGTSAAARVVIPLEPKVETLHVPPGLFCYRLDKSHVVLGGALTDGGSVMEWCRSLLRLETDEEFQECMSVVDSMLKIQYTEMEKPSGSHVSMIPFLSGERSTGFRSGASGCIVGLTRSTSRPAHLVKACMEGVVLRLNAIIQLIRKTLDETYYQKVPPKIIASGKALQHNPLWRQMLADCTGMTVELQDIVHEATSFGAARMVAVSLDMMEKSSVNEKENSAFYLQQQQDDDNEVTTFSRSEPHSVATFVYWRHAASLQEEAIDAMTPTWEK